MPNPQNLQVLNIDFLTLADRLMLAQIVGFMPNQIFFVHGTLGSSAYDGYTRSAPKATLAQALALCGSNQGDVVYLMPGHTETLSTTTQGVAVSLNGVTILGGGKGRARPALTCGAADISGMVVSGASNWIKNVRMIGSTSQTTKTSVILSITGADNIVEDCTFEHGGAGPLDAVSVTAASRLRFVNNEFIGTAAGPDCGIKIFSNLRDAFVAGNQFKYATSTGLDSGGIVASVSADTAGTIFDNNFFVKMDATAIDINGSVAATTCESIISRAYAAFGTGITIANGIDQGGAAAMDCFLTDAIAAAPAWTAAVAKGVTFFPAASPT